MENRNITKEDEKDLKKLSDEYIKAAKLSKLACSQGYELYKINKRQRRVERRLNRERREIKRKYKRKALDIIEDRPVKKRPSKIKGIITIDFIFLCLICLVAFFVLQKIAFLERGYRTIGGEGVFLLIPIATFIYLITDTETEEE